MKGRVGWVMQGWGRVGHTGVGWVGHTVKQPKNYSPQNQDLTPSKSFWKGYKI